MAMYLEVRAWLLPSFKEQYLEEGNLDFKNLDGKTISKTEQNLPSQKPTSSLRTEKHGEHYQHWLRQERKKNMLLTFLA